MRTRPSTVGFRLTVPAVLALSALTAACGSGASASSKVASLGTAATAPENTSGADAPQDMEEAMLAFAQCMRDHGIDMPDPQFNGDGSGGGFNVEMPAGETPEQAQAAQQACQPILQNARGEVDIDPAEQAELEEKVLAYAQCMRDHGIDMPDPTFSDDGGVMIQVGGPPPDGSAPPDSGGPRTGGPREDPQFVEADAACNKDLPRPGSAGRPGDGPVTQTNGG